MLATMLEARQIIDDEADHTALSIGVSFVGSLLVL